MRLAETDFLTDLGKALNTRHNVVVLTGGNAVGGLIVADATNRPVYHYVPTEPCSSLDPLRKGFHRGEIIENVGEIMEKRQEYLAEDADLAIGCGGGGTGNELTYVEKNGGIVYPIKWTGGVSKKHKDAKGLDSVKAIYLHEPEKWQAYKHEMIQDILSKIPPARIDTEEFEYAARNNGL